VAVVATAMLLTGEAGLNLAALGTVAAANTEYAGVVLVGLFAVVAGVAALLWQTGKDPGVR
jgi:hypothetical protein